MREQGSLLLLVLVIISLLVAVVLSFHRSNDALIDVLRDDQQIVGAAFTAESGLEFAASQLLQDLAWRGDLSQAQLLLSGGSFLVAAEPWSPTDPADGFRILSIGSSGDGECRLEARAEYLAGLPPGHETALVHLGGSLDLLDSVVLGDVLIADRAGAVKDCTWDPVAGWVDGPRGPAPPLEFDFTGSAILGDLYRCGETPYGVGVEEHVVEADLSMPEFDLASYLLPGPDRILYEGVNNLKNVTHEETAVFILPPNGNLSLDNCYFPGGVVIHVEPGYNPWDGRRNKVLLKHQTRIGGGDGGVWPTLGMIAPGCEVQFTHPGCALSHDENDIDGFSVFHSVHMVKEARLNGLVMVLDEIKHFRDTWMTYDPAVAASLPPGVDFTWPSSRMSWTAVQEWYGVLPSP